MTDKSGLEDEEKHIIIKAMQALHNLKYISDVAVIGNENKELLRILIEEVVKIREILGDR